MGDFSRRTSYYGGMLQSQSQSHPQYPTSNTIQAKTTTHPATTSKTPTANPNRAQTAS
jgi:hypothetical protein